MPCLAVLEIHDFVTGRMDLGSVARVDEHLDACEICREIVASASTALSGDSDNPGSSAQFLMPPGTLLDRFAIEEVIGRGAMGVVYAAHDPRLDRRVALKLLRADRRSGISSSELIAEAQSMAQLAHPNVVAVYDVGPVAAGEDEFYVAMELVEGVNLRDWIDAKRRPWLEVVTLMSAAGQGLCAAHAAGVCHRDVKPDNIIVGNDGRARVTDFGLARARGGDLRTDDVGELQVTVTALSGTPAYMAPELFSGEPASPASDQYSFCISLFEALYGVRPFPAHSLDELLASASQGRISWPKRSQVPHKIERVLQRGLQPLPENRYPSMVELLAALSSATKSKKRLITVAALSAASAAAVASFAAMSLGAHRESACRDATANIDSAWNPAERDGLAAVLSKSSS